MSPSCAEGISPHRHASMLQRCRTDPLPRTSPRTYVRAAGGGTDGRAGTGIRSREPLVLARAVCVARARGTLRGCGPPSAPACSSSPQARSTLGSHGGATSHLVSRTVDNVPSAIGELRWTLGARLPTSTVRPPACCPRAAQRGWPGAPRRLSMPRITSWGGLFPRATARTFRKDEHRRRCWAPNGEGLHGKPTGGPIDVASTPSPWCVVHIPPWGLVRCIALRHHAPRSCARGKCILPVAHAARRGRPGAPPWATAALGLIAFVRAVRRWIKVPAGDDLAGQRWPVGEGRQSHTGAAGDRP